MSVKTYKLSDVKNKKVSDHFLYNEFACPAYNKLKLDDKLPKYLEDIFKKLNASKAVITSGFRTPEYSVQVGGYKTDKHTKGMAADIIYYDKDGKVISPEKVCCVSEDLGYIGGIAKIGETATHIDTRSVKSKYWGDESTGKYVSIWKMKKGCNSFYDWFGIERPKLKEKIIYYKASKYKGASFVDALKKANIKYDFASRKKIAKLNGIKVYVGGILQNGKLLKLFKKGKLIKLIKKTKQ